MGIVKTDYLAIFIVFSPRSGTASQVLTMAVSQTKQERRQEEYKEDGK